MQYVRYEKDGAYSDAPTMEDAKAAVDRILQIREDVKKMYVAGYSNLDDYYRAIGVRGTT